MKTVALCRSRSAFKGFFYILLSPKTAGQREDIVAKSQLSGIKLLGSRLLPEIVASSVYASVFFYIERDYL